VRQENQDFAAVARIANTQVAIVADGCGGLPHGDLASQQASLAAMNRLRELVPRGREAMTMAREAFRSAEGQLRRIADGRSIGRSPAAGLRTTMLLVVAQPDSFTWGVIGAGMVYLLREDGTDQVLAEANRAEGQPQHMVTASLGPATIGKPEFGTVQRSPGDLLFVATDGVVDRVAVAEFFRSCAKQFLQSEGDLQVGIERIFDDLEELSAEDGQVCCDDNLTLAAIGDGRQPQFGFGFWRSVTLRRLST
jgi:serine/threonine protein phosphatase PrpC